FEVDFSLVFQCFPSLLSIYALTHKISFHRDLSFGYCQDTRQADRAGQKLLFGASCLFYNRDIWVKKVFSLLFPILLPEVFLVKLSVFSVSMYCSKSHNDGSSQNLWAKYATKTV